MCNTAGIKFFDKSLTEAEVRNKRVIEVGSYDVNGSVRSLVERFNPASYLGVDIEMGPGVDELCNILDLAKKYKPESFDIVISTEVVEHVYDWRQAFSNLKWILAPEGILILTTRSIGLGSHGFPGDFWRFQEEDIKIILADMKILNWEQDDSSPGIFVKARRPHSFSEFVIPDDFQLYSIILKKRCKKVPEKAIQRFERWLAVKHAVAPLFPIFIKDYIKRIFNGICSYERK